MAPKNSEEAHDFVADYFVNTSLGRVAKKDCPGNVSLTAMMQGSRVNNY